MWQIVGIWYKNGSIKMILKWNLTIIAFFIIFSIKDLYIPPWSLNYYDNNTIHV